MKTRIDEELDKLDLGTMSLSTLVEEALGIITSSLNNSYGKERIREIAQEIEEKGKSLEGTCINLLLKFQLKNIIRNQWSGKMNIQYWKVYLLLIMSKKDIG